MQIDDVEMGRQAGVEIGITIGMCLAGGGAYDQWLADPKEQAKPNAVGNMLVMVYRAMEAQRRLSL